MNYLIKLFFFFIICYNINTNANTKNEIIFKINNKSYTNIDLENRTAYIALINNLDSSKFSETENNEILNDFVSSLIFNEYYLENKIFYKNLNKEVETIYINFINNNKKLNEDEENNYKFYTNIDLVRKKIIEEKINLQKNSLLQKTNELDLLYNYKLKNIILNKEVLNIEKLNNLKNKNDFDNLKKFLESNKVDFFYKEEDINDNNIISNKIREMINNKLSVHFEIENGYINLLLIEKDLESFEGIYVKLVNFTSTIPFEKEDLKCNKLKDSINLNKTIFKEYEYSKLNNKIKNNLKSIDDYILIKDKNEYNYIILCNLTYDEKILQNLNFNKNVNSLVNKIQTNFLKKYKNEYKFIKIK